MMGWIPEVVVTAVLVIPLETVFQPTSVIEVGTVAALAGEIAFFAGQIVRYWLE